MGGGDGQLVAAWVDGDMTETLDGGKAVVVKSAERLPISGVETDG